MSEKIEIVAEPVSADESEDSWILLDEMDDAMNEDFTKKVYQRDSVDSTVTLNQQNPIEVVNEATGDTSNVENVESSSNEDDVDEEDDRADFYRW